MKSNKKNHRQNVLFFRSKTTKPYPNAAENGYFLHKALDLILMAVTGLGAVSILTCMLLLS